MPRAPTSPERSQRRQRAMEDLAGVVTSGMPIDPLLDAAVSLLATAVHADRCAAFRGPPIRPVAAHGLSRRYLESVVADYRRGPGGLAEATKHTIVIDDIEDDAQPDTWLRAAARHEGFHGIALVPLVYAGEVVGALTLYHDAPAHYEDDDRALVDWFAATLALAIENARRQERIAEQRRFMEEVLEELPVGVLVGVPGEVPELANRFARVVLADNEAANGLRALLDREGKPLGPADSPIDRGLAGEPVDATEISIQRPGTVTTYIVRSRPLSERSVTVFQDVTGDREVEAYKTAVIEIASHALRTPVTALRLSVHSLLRRLHNEEREAPAARNVARQVERLSDLVDHFLAAAALQSEHELRFETIDVGDAVVDAVAAVTQRHRSGRTINVAGGAPPISGDRALIQQAVEELVDNAVVHGAGVIDVELLDSDDADVVRVSDRGPGVPGHRTADLFERFNLARAALPGGGLGLGLFVAAAVARRHGGRLAYEAREHGGASFSLVLPRRRPRAAATGPGVWFGEASP